MHDFRLPIGPQHPSIIEPMHLNLRVEGETVTGLDFSLGYNHRGVERGFEGRPWAKSIYLAERVCGICLPGDSEVILGNGDIIQIGEFVEDVLQKRCSKGNRVLSWNCNSAKIGKVSAVQKFNSPEKLLEIKTKSGSVLRFTHAHPVMIDTPNGPKFLRAEELLLGHGLYAPRKINIEPCSINIIDYLPDHMMINLDDKYYEKLREKLIRKYGNLTDISKKTKIGLWRIHRMKRRFRLHELKKLCEYCKLDWNEAVQNIKQVSVAGMTIKLRTPQMDREIMYVLGLMASDGYFGNLRGNKKNLNHRQTFVNKEKELIRKISKFHKKWFPNKKIDNLVMQSNTPAVRISNPLLSHIAYNLGLNALERKKSDIKAMVKLPDELIASFISGYFDGDGCVTFRERKDAKSFICCIRIYTSDKTMAKRLRLLLKRVGIASGLTSNPSKGFKPGTRYSVTVTNKLDILRFVSRIGSGHPKKMEKFNKMRKFYSSAKTFESIFQTAPKEAVELFRKLRIKYGITPKKTRIQDLCRIEKFEKNVMKWVLKRGLVTIKQKTRNDNDLKRLEGLLSDNFYIDPIAEIKEVKSDSKFVYDLTIPDGHTFIPEGEFVVSNCSFHHQLCFTQGVEKLMGIRIPERAGYIRTIIAELERLHNHYLWMGLLAFEMGFDTLFHYLIRDRELVMELFEILCGNRVHYSINTIGGVRRDLDMEKAKLVEKNLDALEERSRHYLKVFSSDTSVLKRIKGMAILPKKQAGELNVVGPVARASGIGYDIRDLGYLKYRELKFKPVVEEEGDILARTIVRIRETLESVRLVQNALVEIPEGKIGAKAPLKAPDGETTSRVEALRGELFYYILSGQDHPHRVRIRTPTYANIHCLRQILTGSQIADVPVAVMSLDPCWACCDRMTLVDARTGAKREVTKEELRHAY